MIRNLRAIFVGVILFVMIQDSIGSQLYAPTYTFMNVDRTDGSGQSLRVCANFYPNSIKKKGALPMARSLDKAKPYTLAYYDRSDLICNKNVETSSTTTLSFAGDIVHTYLHFDSSCDLSEEPQTINERILEFQSLNASALLFVTTPDETYASYYDPRVNGSLVSIPIYYINRETQDQFAKFVGTNRSMSNQYRLRFFVPEESVVDAGMVLILIIAVICVAVGGLWSGYRHFDLFLQEATKQQVTTASESSVISRMDNQDGIGAPPHQASNGEQPKNGATIGTASTEPAAAPFNCISLVVFIVIIVGFLLLMYYFYNVMVWMIIVIFVVASSSAMCECLYFLVQKIPHGKCAFRLDPLAEILTKICRCCQWKMFRVTVEYRHVILYSLCLSFAVTWCVYRHWSFAFVLHDTLAMFFSIVTIRNLRIPNLMWITYLLSTLLVYDLFMVFITPYFTSTGCSIMIDVATGGACSSSAKSPDAAPLAPNLAPQKEELPIMIRMPRFNDPVWPCYRMDVDLQYPPVILGLGDIILPGVLVGFTAAYSIAARTPYRLYYVVCVLGYIAGMIATFVALVMSRAAQPALIYLVPFTLIPTHILALARKEWKKLWRGQFPLAEETCPILKPDGSETGTQHVHSASHSINSSDGTTARI